jgi:hypothetical protein
MFNNDFCSVYELYIDQYNIALMIVITPQIQKLF